MPTPTLTERAPSSPDGLTGVVNRRRRHGAGFGDAVDRHAAPIFLAPALVGVLLVDGFPLVYGLVISLFNQSLSNAHTRFVGLHNYAVALADPSTWHSIWLSVIFTVASVAVSFVLGLVTALLLNPAIPGRSVMRAIIIIPWAVPAFVAALTWQWMYNDQFGIISALMERVGLHPPVWLSAQWAMFSLILVMVWKSFPFQVVLLLAGLQAIPDEIYEAAKTDGASVWRRFTTITMPLLAPVSAISVIMAAINAFQYFPIPWILTAGGPAGATSVIPIQSFNLAFQAGQISQGATLATIMFLLILVAASVYLWRYVKQVGEL